MKESMTHLKKKIAPYARSTLIALGWGTSFGAINLWAVFQGLLLPTMTLLHGQLPPDGPLSESQRIAIYYLALFGISAIAAMVLADFGRALGGLIVSYLTGGAIVFATLSAPVSAIDNLRIITRDGLNLIAIDLTFRVVFPLPLFALLLGTITGVALEERYL